MSFFTHFLQFENEWFGRKKVILHQLLLNKNPIGPNSELSNEMHPYCSKGCKTARGQSSFCHALFDITRKGIRVIQTRLHSRVGVELSPLIQVIRV